MNPRAVCFLFIYHINYQREFASLTASAHVHCAHTQKREHVRRCVVYSGRNAAHTPVENSPPEPTVIFLVT